MAVIHKHMARVIKLFRNGSNVGRVYGGKKSIVLNNTSCHTAYLPELCRTGSNHGDDKHRNCRKSGLSLLNPHVFSHGVGEIHPDTQNKLLMAINLSSTCGFHTSTANCVMEDRQTKALTVWNNIRELRASPLPALSLGLAGLLPFVGVPTYMLLGSSYLPQLAFGQVVYGASILSFLGGVRWGFTIPEENPIPSDWKNLGYSVIPPLVACVGLMLPSPMSLFTVMGGLSAVAYFDMAMYGYPPWFKGLRFLLSFVAVLSLWTTFVCSLLLDTKTETPIQKKSKED